MAFRQFNVGNPFLPRIDWRMIKYIIDFIGVKVIHRSKYTATKCSCWITKSGHPDPFCSTCNGGGYIYTDREFKAHIFPEEPVGRSGIADFVTQAGPFQRYNHRMYCVGTEGKNIAVGDTIITKKYEENGIRLEYDVVHVYTRTGSYGARVYTHCFLMRKPYADTGETDPTKSTPIG